MNMKKVIILHGMPSKEEFFDPASKSPSKDHWLSWLKEKLLNERIAVKAPELPVPYAPVYEQWKEMFEKFSVDKETALVGHSCGAGFLVRYLSENKVHVGKVILVAPWIDPDLNRAPEFFSFTMDKDMVQRTAGVTIFVSDDDDNEILTSATKIRAGIKDVALKEFHGKGHFTFGDMKTEAFPELLDTLLYENEKR